ncbi:MAG: hypothetical protein OHK0046_19040 [Anaerolineae bacterium]
MATADRQHTIDEYNAHAWELRFQNLPQAADLCWAAHQQASEEPRYERGLAESLRTLSYLYHSLSQHEEALRYGLRALDLFILLKDDAEQIRTLNIIGSSERESGGYADALRHHLQALRLTRETNNAIDEIRSINHIGFVYMRLGDYANALRNFEQSLQLAQAAHDSHGQADAHNFIGQTLFSLGKVEDALRQAEFGLRLYRDANHRQGEVDVLLHIGHALMSLENIAQAITYYEHALHIAGEIGQDTLETLSLISLGKLYIMQKQPAKALGYLQEAHTLAESSHASEHLYHSHEALALHYKHCGQFQAALHHQEQAHLIAQAISHEQSRYQIRALQAAYDLEAARTEAQVNHTRTIELQREMHDRVRVEEALHQANQKLRQEIDHREQLISDLDAYAHTVAHDLKAPLALVIAYSNLLLTDMSEELSTERVDWLTSINQAGLKMTQIIDELLMLARTHKQNIFSEPVNMTQVIQETQSRLAFMINEHGARIDVATDLPPAFGYTTWVEEVWTNYISNAIKYGGHPPVITLGATPQDDGYIRYWVKDNGSGLRPEDQRVVFTQFKRLQNTMQVEGHGLGLSIVKRIVEKLGGQVKVESDGIPGRGCTFSFTLRAAG